MLIPKDIYYYKPTDNETMIQKRTMLSKLVTEMINKIFPKEVDELNNNRNEDGSALDSNAEELNQLTMDFLNDPDT